MATSPHPVFDASTVRSRIKQEQWQKGAVGRWLENENSQSPPVNVNGSPGFALLALS